VLARGHRPRARPGVYRNSVEVREGPGRAGEAVWEGGAEMKSAVAGAPKRASSGRALGAMAPLTTPVPQRPDARSPELGSRPLGPGHLRLPTITRPWFTSHECHLYATPARTTRKLSLSLVHPRPERGTDSSSLSSAHTPSSSSSSSSSTSTTTHPGWPHDDWVWGVKIGPIALATREEPGLNDSRGAHERQDLLALGLMPTQGFDGIWQRHGRCEPGEGGVPRLRLTSMACRECVRLGSWVMLQGPCSKQQADPRLPLQVFSLRHFRLRQDRCPHKARPAVFGRLHPV
jgi:hypothetical protein